MIIRHEGVDYRCFYRSYGFSYVRPVAQRKVSYLGGLFKRWEEVASILVGTPYLIGQEGNWLPEEYRANLLKALKAKIEYEAAWRAERGA